VGPVRCREGSKSSSFKYKSASARVSLVVVVMMVMVVVMIIMVMMMVVVMIVMMIVMMIVVMVIVSHDHRFVFRLDGIIAALVLGAQNLLGIRDGLQQFRK
jgi:uncharacterized membrane protein